jgi:transcriptional regulator GlxA family with amidase domain
MRAKGPAASLSPSASPSPAPSPRTAILLFEGAEELDVFGPLSVFGTANAASMKKGSVYLVGKKREPVALANGTRVTPTYGGAEVPPPEYLIVPGGPGVKAGMDDADLLRIISVAARTAQWIGSVGSGALLVAMAGPGIGKRMATHPQWAEQLRRVNQPELVIEGSRYLWDEPVASSASSSAGIEMALWMTGKAYSEETPERVAKALDYVLPPAGK